MRITWGIGPLKILDDQSSEACRARLSAVLGCWHGSIFRWWLAGEKSSRRRLVGLSWRVMTKKLAGPLSVRAEDSAEGREGAQNGVSWCATGCLAPPPMVEASWPTCCSVQRRSMALAAGSQALSRLSLDVDTYHDAGHRPSPALRASLSFSTTLAPTMGPSRERLSP
jgi:hypothetical protein